MKSLKLVIKLILRKCLQLTLEFLSIPVILHEQNAIAGTANRINYYFAKRVYETFPLSFNISNSKIIHTGNPVRPSFSKLIPPEEKYNENKSSINILVMGGSQGSRFLNKTMPFAFSHFYKGYDKLTFLFELKCL